jgi:hypothetical protein
VILWVRAADGAADGACHVEPRSEVTSSDRPSVVTDTQPSSSVRHVRAPLAAIRAIVPSSGWPYVLPRPTLAMAAVGWIASRNACVVAVRLP